jgi:hypothetical protein
MMDQTHRSKEHYEHTNQRHAVVQLHQAQECEHREREPVGHEHDHSRQVMPEEQHAQQHEQRASHDDGVTIYIDHKPYSAASAHVTGAELRELPNPPIGADKDIFHAISGKSDDIKVGDADVVDINLREVNHGRHFYSARKALAEPTEGLAKKAYFIYLNQGSQNGHDVEHWLAAEKQIACRENT